MRFDGDVPNALRRSDHHLARAFERHADALHRAARRMLPGAPDRADDLVQETFLRYVEASRRRLCDEPSLPLLMWLLRRRVLDDVDARRRRPDCRPLEEHEASLCSRSPEPVDAAVMGEQLADVLRHTTALPNGQRAALVHTLLGGRTHAELAAELDTTPAAVKALVHRARSNLRRTRRAA